MSKRGEMAETTTVRLGDTDRQNIALIGDAGFATGASEAIRVSLAFLAMSLKQTKWPTALGVLGMAESARDEVAARFVDPPETTDATDVYAAAHEALRIAESGECACRAATGRHQLLVAMLQELLDRRRAPWVDILDRAKRLAVRFNAESGLPPTARPGSVVFTPGAMNISWMRGYLGSGARYGERYSSSGPEVPLMELRGAKGPELAFAK
jgi:hypothetical protein